MPGSERHQTNHCYRSTAPTRGTLGRVREFLHDCIHFESTYPFLQNTFRINRYTNEVKQDSFIIRKSDGTDGKYFKAVIDKLLRVKFIRNECDFKVLESIRISPGNARNKHSVKMCAASWGRNCRHSFYIFYMQITKSLTSPSCHAPMLQCSSLNP